MTSSAKKLEDFAPRTALVIPYFLKPQHPKATIAPERHAVKTLLDLGFAGQRKVNGHRAQIHVSKDEIVAFTRQGTKHTSVLDESVKTSLRRIFAPETGWNTIDCEWQKQEGKLYVFDLLRLNDKLLKSSTYEQRFELLRALFALDPRVEFLPLIKTVEACMLLLADPNPMTEGLVFRNVKSIGFDDGAIIRCRKSGVFFEPEKLK